MYLTNLITKLKTLNTNLPKMFKTRLRANKRFVNTASAKEKKRFKKE